jgi:hypothetical protein
MIPSPSLNRPDCDGRTLPSGLRRCQAVRKNADNPAGMRKQGAVPAESSTEHLPRFLAEDLATIGPLVKSIGLKLE